MRNVGMSMRAIAAGALMLGLTACKAYQGDTLATACRHLDAAECQPQHVPAPDSAIGPADDTPIAMPIDASDQAAGDTSNDRAAPPSIDLTASESIETAIDMGLAMDTQGPLSMDASMDTLAPGCSTGLAMCASACVDLDVDSLHCGSCEGACAPGSVCSNGICQVTCQAGLKECSGTCVNLAKDPDHCGDCDSQCPANQLCTLGTCVCPAGTVLCGSDCVDTRYDPTNCGNCAITCAVGEMCADGKCISVAAPQPRCQSVLAIGLNAKDPYSAQTSLPVCTLQSDGSGRMVFTLPTCGDGPYAACVFANGVNLNAFDADNQAAGVLEVEFCISVRMSGELNLWYGAFPTRKKIELIGPAEVMNPGCSTVRRAPEQAVCHWTARPEWAGDCGGSDVPGEDKSCRACGSQCNQGCPISFASTRLTLSAEQCVLTQNQPVTVDLKAVSFLPRDCTCTADSQCAGSPERTTCDSGLFSSKVCSASASLCGVCAPPEASCPMQGQSCIVELSNRSCPGTIQCRGAFSLCAISDMTCAQG